MPSPIAQTVRLRSFRDLGLLLPVAALVLGPVGFLAWMGLGGGIGDLAARMNDLGVLATVGRVFLLACATTLLAATM
ncbi:MAG TPA: hypothetical protein VJ565_00995, partial [Dehalococcoidia bacterium]|nr:hypothetical protein [Dehalococcoidia bacterium]